MDIKVFNYLPDGALDVRITVFVDEQGFCDEVDDTDSVATHLLMFDGEKPIATCRIFPGETPEKYILGRLCVLREYRSQGLGSTLLAAAEKAAKNNGAHSLWLHSQLQAKDFYSRLGYIVSSDIEYEQHAPHVWMKKDLT
ncbi:MAG: GNAT family N-acetyltransferase [Clostridia bacterium]|nr:GNAT family N-acetyltransferase [Clostridia bacterium]